MKKIIFLIMFGVLWLNVIGQAPYKLSYQAVIRDAGGNLVAGSQVGMRITILAGALPGTAVYQETQTPTTNTNGLVTVEIGGGGGFNTIDWGNGIYYIKTETDPSGGTTYTITGTNQLLSVPYALYAKDVQNKNDADADTTNELQKISISGTILTLDKKGGSVTLPSSGGGDNWGTQSVYTNPTLTGNGTTTSPLGIVQSQLQPGWANIGGKPATLAGYGITDAMSTAHTANSITSSMITNWNTAYGWGNHAGLYKTAGYFPSWSEITGIPAGFADGTDNVDDADADKTNEIQTISLSGTVLTLSKEGGTVILPSSGGGDNWGTQTASTDATLAGSGTTTAPLKLAQQSATSGQVLKWNGSTWLPATDETGSGGTTPTGPAGGDLTGSYPDPAIATGKVTSAKILDGTIEATDLAASAVTSVKIADGAVASADLADNSVISAKIADGTIATADIADNAVSSAKIPDGTISTADLAATAVTTDKLFTGAVTTDKLSASAVTADKISTGAVTGTKIAQAGATTGQALKWNGTTWAPANDETGSGGTTPTGPAGGDLTGSYPDPAIATGKVTSAKILDGTIEAADLAVNAVTSVKIADGAVASADLADYSVTSAKIDDGTIATVDLANNAVTSSKILDGTIATADLATSAVTSDILSASAVTADKISTGAVTGTKIAQAGATLGQTLKWFGSTWAPANDETGSGGTTPTGPAGGDLTGSYPDPLVGDGKITSAKILDGTLAASDLAAGAVTSVKIADGAVATADLADNAVTSLKIADGAIANADIADNAVTSIKVLDGTIATGDLAGSAVTTDKIADHAVAVSKLPPGAAPDNFLRGDGAWAIPTVGSVTEFDPTWEGPANLDGDIGRFGDVGIGTVTPTALLHTNGTGTGGGNVLFEGEYKTYFPGDPPVEGAGTRMMWYPDQAVFRMGAVSDDRWDAANLGSFSTAIGYNCVASGSVALSIGSYTTASNTCSVAIGHGTQSTAYAATALGYSTLASGYATTAMGDNTVAQAYVSTAIGQYNVGNGSTNSWEETDPIFELGIGRSHLTRKNAMTVLKNGYVGIGTPTPEAGLHVFAEGWPGSFVYLEADAGNDAGLRFYESTTPKWHIFNDASVGGLMIQNNATTPAIYCNQSNAYVGIRTSSPTQALHVAGDAYKTSGGTSWATSSDLRLKYITGNYTKGLNEITALQPVKFMYRENNPRQLTPGVEQVGFVAQEVKKVFPEAVTEAVDGYLDFNIHSVNVALVNAVKELKAENDLLKARLEKLEKLIEASAQK